MSIFISHANADKKLVKAFVNLLQTGVDVRAKNIFCTSIEGLGIPTGKDFVTFIKERLGDAKFVIALITPQYYESLFCVCELGATWIQSKTFFPFLVPPLTYSDLKAVLLPTQAAKINDEAKLSELYDALVKAKLGTANTSKWQVELDVFLKALPKILRDLEGPSVVKAEKYKELEETYGAAQEKIAKLTKSLEKEREKFAKLEKVKDAAGVKELKRQYSSKEKQFNAAVAEAKSALDGLPNVVVEALYFRRLGKEWSPNLGFGMDDLRDEVESAEQHEYITRGESGIEVNDSHPEVSDAIDALDELDTFLTSSKLDDFRKEFKEENRYPLSIENRRFWKEFLGL
jgi:TIR domain